MRERMAAVKDRSQHSHILYLFPFGIARTRGWVDASNLLCGGTEQYAAQSIAAWLILVEQHALCGAGRLGGIIGNYIYLLSSSRNTDTTG